MRLSFLIVRLLKPFGINVFVVLIYILRLSYIWIKSLYFRISTYLERIQTNPSFLPKKLTSLYSFTFYLCCMIYIYHRWLEVIYIIRKNSVFSLAVPLNDISMLDLWVKNVEICLFHSITLITFCKGIWFRLAVILN